MIALLLALLQAVEQPVAAPVRDAEAARVFLEQRRAEQGFPGAQFGWSEAGGESGAIAVGLRERGKDEALHADDRMLWGSVGKTFVAAVALQLAAAGQIGLEDRVADHLGEEAWYSRLPNAGTVTIRQLLNHTSGIPDHVRKTAAWESVRADPDRAWATAELLAFVLDDPPLAPAGEQWSYADTNFVLLGAVLERRTGQPLFDLVRDRLLTPLRLTDASPADRRRLPGLVQGHPALLREEWGLPERTLANGIFFMNPQFEHGGGGMYGAPEALARWTRLLHAGEVLPAALRAARLEGVPIRPGARERYGLGVQLWPSALGEAAGHGGWFPGYRTETAWFAEAGLAACVILNTDASREVRDLRALLVGCVRALIGTAD